jgi:hypothetical protein
MITAEQLEEFLTHWVALQQLRPHVASHAGAVFRRRRGGRTARHRW